MQGISTYIPETNYIPRDYSVAAILLLLFMVLISLVSVLNLLYFYISTFRSIIIIIIKFPYFVLSGFGGLGVACWPLVPKFTGSNPAEAV